MIFPPTPNSEHDVPVSGTKSDATPHNAARIRAALKSHASATKSHLVAISEHDNRLQELISTGREGDVLQEPVEVNGEDLTPAELVAVACYKAPVCISRDEKVRSQVDESVKFLTRHLEEGNVVYGINTGYGGSADTRSADFLSMQRGLIQHHNSAVLLSSDLGATANSDLLSHLGKHHLPRSVVRGSMLTRCNSLMRGHSAVRLSVIEAIATLLNHDLVPIVPLRGSISASGDLTPLSYIAGALEGNNDIYIDFAPANGPREVLPAGEALRRAGLSPIVMRPKEGLGLMNGTAVSCAAGTLALHETQYLALAAQVLTGMCTEALRGSADNFHPFISHVRPHPGQEEAAQNISRLLEGSRLVVGKDARTAGLYQDRYGLRTAPQWIGPQLEDLSSSAYQLAVELNSTTDNPLVDAKEGYVHHGGNFQAAAVTSAMEKARLALQMLGKLMFSQCSELINPMLNAHLTPNLCFDDPGVSFTFKGVDINMAAYMSELAFLANPVSSHVQSAEMHNQAVNSLALISARFTLDAVELVSLMTAAYLYALCQALDLHVLFLEYTSVIEQKAQVLLSEIFKEHLPASTSAPAWSEVMGAIRSGLISAKNKDTPERARATAEATIVPLINAMTRSGSAGNGNVMPAIQTWVEQLTDIVSTSIRDARSRMASGADEPSATTTRYLGHGSAVVYNYVRRVLGISQHKGLVNHPTYPGCERDGIMTTESQKVTIGRQISVIYEALRSGGMRGVLIESLSGSS